MGSPLGIAVLRWRCYVRAFRSSAGQQPVNRAAMLSLTTFGGLSLHVSGTPALGAAQQRKPLALLAVLASAGRRGVSRDKLIVCLWPEADTDHGRGLLKQACYVLRRDLDAPEIFLGATELRLNPAVITSDVEAFQQSLERRDLAQAAALYAGAFLDGFFLGDSVEFDRWVEAERERLRQRACEALEAVAGEIGVRGDHRTAVQWWRRLADIDSLSGRVTRGLMNALVAAGDRSGALQVSRAYERRVREELDAVPEAAIIDLTERLRRESGADLSPAPPRAGDLRIQIADSSGNLDRRHYVWRIRGRRQRMAGMLVLTAAALFVAARFAMDPSKTPGDTAAKRIVVLPFANLGPAEDQYFADGLSEEINARLAAIPALRVIGATSANSYKGTNKSIQQIGADLGVQYVITGAVRWQRSSGGVARIRVTPRLISVADGSELWSQTYDEPFAEIFRLQRDIAGKLVGALDITALERQRRLVEASPTASLEAYDYYLRGNDYTRRGYAERQVRSAMHMYEQAVMLDSNFAAAFARLSRTHSFMYWFHYDRSIDQVALAKRSADRAFALNRDLPETHQALADYYFLAHLDYDRALQEFAAASAMRPSDSEFLLGAAVVRGRQGKVREAIPDLERAMEFDPGSSLVVQNAAQQYDLLRDFVRAERLYSRALALSPDWSDPYFTKAWLYLRWKGEPEKARAVLADARALTLTDDPRLRLVAAWAELFDGKYEQALDALAPGAPDVMEDQMRFIPRAQIYAQVYGLLQRHTLERVYYDSARRITVEAIAKWPDDSRLHSALGIAYAGLGRKQEAIAAGRKAVELLPVSRDAYRGYHRELDLARIHLMVGEQDDAMDGIEQLLSMPGLLTAAWLRRDPTWNPLRHHPRFKRIVDSAP